MLAAGSIPNVFFCLYLMNKNRSRPLMTAAGGWRAWGLSILMGLLWGGSIFLYGAATPLLGDMGPSIGWPLSLAVGLLVANLMGVLLGEWRNANPNAARLMRYGIVTIMVAIILCAASSKLGVVMKALPEVCQKLRERLIVSCQAPEGDIFHGRDAMARFAVAARQGGAAESGRTALQTSLRYGGRLPCRSSASRRPRFRKGAG